MKYFLDRRSDISVRHAEHKRETYDELIKIFLDAMEGPIPQKELKKRTSNAYRTLVLYASPQVLKAYGDQMQYAYSQKSDTKVQLIYLARLFKAMRRDLGLNSRLLGRHAEKILRPKFNDYRDYFKEDAWK